MPCRFRPRIETLEDRRLLATITDLGTLGGTDADATAINARGQVTGASPTDNGDIHPFLYQRGQIADLGMVGIYESFGLGLNDAGQVVGLGLTKDFTFHAFLAANGTVTDLGTLGGINSAANGINDAGQVVGYAATGKGSAHAFVYAGGVMNDLGTLGGDASSANGINNAGQIAGWSDTSGPYPQATHAFLYSDGKMTDLGTLPGSTDSYATAVNDRGQVAGSSAFAAPLARHAFLYSDGQMTDLGTLPNYSYGSFATALNNRGDVVGYAITAGSSSQHAFLYRDGQMLDLNDLIPSGQSWELTSATGISDKGQIVGSGIHDGFFRAFLLDLSASDGSHGLVDAALATGLASTPAAGTLSRPATLEESPKALVHSVSPRTPLLPAAEEAERPALSFRRLRAANPVVPEELLSGDAALLLVSLMSFDNPVR